MSVTALCRKRDDSSPARHAGLRRTHRRQGSRMFERFTDEARQVVVLAPDEARDARHTTGSAPSTSCSACCASEEGDRRATCSRRSASRSSAARTQVERRRLRRARRAGRRARSRSRRAPRRCSSSRSARRSRSGTTTSAPSTSCSASPARTTGVAIADPRRPRRRRRDDPRRDARASPARAARRAPAARVPPGPAGAAALGVPRRARERDELDVRSGSTTLGADGWELDRGDRPSAAAGSSSSARPAAGRASRRAEPERPRARRPARTRRRRR